MAGRGREKKFVIKPRQQEVLNDEAARERWGVLKRAIHRILEQNASSLSFEELYRNAYNLVLHNQGNLLYEGVYDTVKQHLQKVAVKVADVPDDLLLAELNKQWGMHELTMGMIRDILMYMDRVFVQKTKKHPVYHFGLILFREVIVRHPRVKHRLQNTLLSNVQRERSGEIIDRGLMKNTLHMLEQLGIDSTLVYETEFEQEFLHATVDFYRTESQEFLAHNTCPVYLEKAERRLDQERQRVEDYLCASTRPKLREIVERHLIQEHARTLVEMESSGLVAMLRDDKHADLARMYRLFNQVPGCADILRLALREYITGLGKQLVTDSEEAKSPVEFVQRLLDMRDKFGAIVSKSFDGEKAFERTLREAFEVFMNMDTRCAQFLSTYTDEMLRHKLKGMSEEEVENRLNKVVLLFRLLTDKDIFEGFYKNHLQKRLLGGKSMSDDWERAMISKLKGECGYQFTSKLEGMFTDMRMSKELMAVYRNEKPPPPIKMEVTVLTTGFWPVQDTAPCTLPPQLVACCEHFERFYLRSRQGRRLTWQTSRGTADLRAMFGTRRRELTVSTFQMVILLMFNSRDTITYGEIASATRIPDAELRRHLISLTTPRNRILLKLRKSKDIKDDDEFQFNEAFTSKWVKVKVALILARSVATEDPADAKVAVAVEEDRRHLIEAAIVRIMKARRTLEHNTLVAEVTKQLNTRFSPAPAQIKKRIESLIEREYLERAAADRRVYNYLA
uniref:Cullin family profile domain-containing protein n=1 Tax=Bicosoecida sp. CB-2014 TaxID=1486930 RepID=A0A7S1C1S1_9STRA|mmetsp:Transcript_106/g.386  ORF Transcript_106/g.386 Transcript_106/m.386 type:complete len:734 (+) Transcript_106:563-2764(+)